ncbi:hypothetical protein ACFLQ8_00950 [Candidatus Auribacterota bacterium]
MKMKRTILIVAITMALCADCFARSASETIADKSSCLLVMRMTSDDKGIGSILNACKKWFLKEKIGPEVNDVIEDFNILEFDEIAIGVFPYKKGQLEFLAVGDINSKDASVTFKVKDVNLKLSIKERDNVKGLQEGIVKSILERWVDESDRRSDKDGVVFSRAREKRGDISSYGFIKNQVIVGSKYDLVKSVRKSLAKSSVGSVHKKNLLKFLKKQSKTDDGYFFIDNSDKFLTNFVRVREAAFNTPLLLSGDAIDSLGIFFDIANKDTINARIIFQANDPFRTGDIKVDAQFLAEFLRRRLMVEKIYCKYKIITKRDYVVIAMTFKNIEQYLNNLLSRSRASAK